MSNVTQINRMRGIQRPALWVAAGGLLVALAGLLLDQAEFWRAYLFAYLFWLEIALGCLGLVLLHHLAGGRWSASVRGIAESAALTLPAFGLLFLPLLVALPQLYPWADGAQMAASPLLQQKSAWLNLPFFGARAVVYFGVWSLLAVYLHRLSQAEAAAGGSPEITAQLHRLSALGMILYFVTATFAAFDWMMSLEPAWFSSIYGLHFLAGQAVAAISLAIIGLAATPPPSLPHSGGGAVSPSNDPHSESGDALSSSYPHSAGGETTAPSPKWGGLGWGFIAGLVGTGLLLAGFIQADRNWFTDTAFTKDQWRELASYVQGQKGENEAVVLVSGHAWPVWRYYAPQIEAVRLPDIEILDINAVVDLNNSTAILRPALLDKTGAWLVGWQEEVVDPADAAGMQLIRAGVEQPFDAQFWGVKLRHYTQLDARAISDAPPIQQPVQANFGDAVELLGYSIEKSGDLLLFWRLTHPPTPLPDIYLTGETRTATGLLFSRMGDRRLSAYDFPTFRWQIGQIVAGRIPMDEWIGAGAPAGNYQLRLGVYDPARDTAGMDLIGPDGTRLGKRATVEIALPQPIALSEGEDPTTWHPLVDGLFVRPILINSRGDAGGSLLLQILWFTPVAQRVDSLTLHWNERKRAVQRDGQPVTVDLSLPAQQTTRTVHQIPIPLDLPPGDYWLELTAESMPTRPVELPVTILSSSRHFDLPPLAPRLSARFGEEIGLAGLTESELPVEIEPEATLPLTFVWQSHAPAPTDYTMSVQWLDGEGRPARQVDEVLPRGSSTWLLNEVVSQIIKLAAPAQPGEYRLIVAVYDASRNGLPRLRLPDGDDFVEVARIRVQSPAQP